MPPRCVQVQFTEQILGIHFGWFKDGFIRIKGFTEACANDIRVTLRAGDRVVGVNALPVLEGTYPTLAELIVAIGAERPVTMTFALEVCVNESTLVADLAGVTHERDEAIEALNLIVAERGISNLHRAEAVERRSSGAQREWNLEADNGALRAAPLVAGCTVTPRVRSESFAAAAEAVEHACAPACATTAFAASSAAKARAFETIWAVEEAFSELLEAERAEQLIALDVSLTPSSSYKGVRWNKKQKVWTCYVWADLKKEGKCKSVYLGSFDSEKAAARAYDNFVIENGLEKVLNFTSRSGSARAAAASATHGQIPPPAHRLITGPHRGGAQGVNPLRPLARKRRRASDSPSGREGQRLRAGELKDTTANRNESKRAKPLQLKTGASIEEIVCSICKGGGDEASMLLCGDGVGGCDHAFHAYCLDPPLKAMPAAEDDWFCARCTGERSSSGAQGATATAKRTAMPTETATPMATGMNSATAMKTRMEMATQVIVAQTTATQAAMKQVAATHAVTIAVGPLETRFVAVRWSTGGMEWCAREKARILSSGHCGVWWDKRAQEWKARARVGKGHESKHVTLGSFAKSDAACAYDAFLRNHPYKWEPHQWSDHNFPDEGAGQAPIEPPVKSDADVAVAAVAGVTSDAIGVATASAVMHAAPLAASPAAPPVVSPSVPLTVPPAMPPIVPDVPADSDGVPTVHTEAVPAAACAKQCPSVLSAVRVPTARSAACDAIESGCGGSGNDMVNAAKHAAAQAAQAAAPRVVVTVSGGADSECTRTRPTRERHAPIFFKPCPKGVAVFLSFTDCVTGDRVVFAQHRGVAGHVEKNSVDILENGKLWRSTQQKVCQRLPLCFVEWNARKRTLVDYVRKGSSLFTYEWTVPDGIDAMACGAAMEQCAASIGFEFRVRASSSCSSVSRVEGTTAGGGASAGGAPSVQHSGRSSARSGRDSRSGGKSVCSTLLPLPTRIEAAASVMGPAAVTAPAPRAARAQDTSDAQSRTVVERPRIKRKRGSRFFGVCLDGSATKWKAEIYAEGRNQFLGHFDDETDAALAYDAFIIDKKLDIRVNFPS